MLLCLQRNHESYYARGTQDGHLDFYQRFKSVNICIYNLYFHTAPELCGHRLSLVYVTLFPGYTERQLKEQAAKLASLHKLLCAPGFPTTRFILSVLLGVDE